MPAVKAKVKKSIKSKFAKKNELRDLLATLSRGKLMWESTFDAISSPVMLLTSDYEVKRANLALATATSIDVRQTIGKKCYEIFAGKKQPCSDCPLRKTYKSKKENFQILASKMRNERSYEVNSYLLDLPEESSLVIMHYRDITEEKELQNRLIQSEKMAAIGMLAGGVAHEINNPLGGILAFAQLAMREIPEEHPAFGDLKEIEEAALRCKRIVQDLLDFSRQNKDDMMAALNLNDVLLKIIPLIRVQARNSNIELISDLDSSIPVTKGNVHKLQQVFLNLITNAYQAMGKKGGRLLLKTRIDSANSIQLIVSDTGPGISRDNLHKIFDPYFTTKAQGEGTGLGLSISYGIIKEHGGNIHVESEPGSGASFIVSLPVASPQKPARSHTA